MPFVTSITEGLSNFERAIRSPDMYCDETLPSMIYRPGSIFPVTVISFASIFFVMETPKGARQSASSLIGLSISLPFVLKISFLTLEDLTASATGIMKRSVEPLSLQLRISSSAFVFSSARRHAFVALISSLSSSDSLRKLPRAPKMKLTMSSL